MNFFTITAAGLLLVAFASAHHGGVAVSHSNSESEPGSNKQGAAAGASSGLLKIMMDKLVGNVGYERPPEGGFEMPQFDQIKPEGIMDMLQPMQLMCVPLPTACRDEGEIRHYLTGVMESTPSSNSEETLGERRRKRSAAAIDSGVEGAPSLPIMPPENAVPEPLMCINVPVKCDDSQMHEMMEMAQKALGHKLKESKKEARKAERAAVRKANKSKKGGKKGENN